MVLILLNHCKCVCSEDNWNKQLEEMQLNSLRNRKQALKIVQELDAFPKVPESYQETTATGGGGMSKFSFC
jgi:hypothetical protein